MGKDNIGEVVSFGQLQADDKFKEQHKELINIFDMLDEPVLLCSPGFEVVWANIPAQRDFTELTCRGGITPLIAEHGRDKLIEVLEQNSEYTLSNILLLGGTEARFRPLCKDGEISAVAVLLKSAASNKKPGEARPVIHRSKTPRVLECGIRNAMERSFDTLELVSKSDVPGIYVEDLTMRNNQILRIVNNFISYANLISGETRMDMKAVNLPAWIENLSGDAEAMAKQAGIVAAISNADEECYAMLDMKLFETAFFNILHNAFYYTKPGGKVMITVHIVEPHVYIIVKDTGLGIPPHLLESGEIYAPHFSYVHNTPAVTAGLGLTLAREIIEMHDGTIKISSDQDTGTIVDIRLNTVDAKTALSFEQEAIVYERRPDRFSALDIGLAGIKYKPDWGGM
ncbi:MAG: HAMP domain-containing histidine kinase [Oscillospiraceae bacterium]|nr:HAMP domain-containing histidine kinase [Oscillospiraceae bacterium]